MPDNLPIDGSNTLGDLADRIGAEHEQVTNATRTALTHAIKAGELLLAAKDHAGHGRFQSWVEKTCNLPLRTARLYMELASNRAAIEVESKRQRVAVLTVRAALRLLKPKSEKKANDRPRKKSPPRAGALNSLAWSDAKPEARTKFIDDVGVRALWDAMTPEQRAAIVVLHHLPAGDAAPRTVKHSASGEMPDMPESLRRAPATGEAKPRHRLVGHAWPFCLDSPDDGQDHAA